MSFNKFRAILRASSVLSRTLCARPNAIHHHRTFNYTTSTCPDPNVLPIKAEVKMKIEFTCKICSTRNEKYFSKAAYTHGVVIIRCDGCSNNHLIADNLKWFNSDKRNIEDILAEKGIDVKKSVITDAPSEENDERERGR